MVRRPVAVLLLAVALAAVAFAPAASAGTPPQQPRIVGGHVAAPGTWPAIVALMDLSRSVPPGDVADWDQQICGGTLIAPQWVLTAAHCITDEGTGAPEPAAQFAIMYGSHALDDTGTRDAVVELHRHPAYVPSTTANDLALLKLATPVPGASVLPVTIPALSGLWAEGKTAQVAGWGNVEKNAPGDTNPPVSYPVDLMELTTLPLVSDADCDEVYNPFTPAVMFCAGDLTNGGVDTCQGDSGGPLVVADAAGHPVLAGDTSFGAGCAWPGVPGVYGEIAAMRAFVDQTLGWSTAASADHASLDFVPAAAGTPTAAQTATLTSTGTAPLSVAAARLAGAGAADFRITRDGCGQVVLTPGQACSVDVVAQTGGGATGATLALDADAAAATTSVALTAAAVPPPAPAPPVTPPAPAPPPAAPPVAPVKPKAPALKALSALSRHRLSVKLAGPGTVTVTIARKVKKHGKTVSETLATGTATFAKAGTKTITLKLTRAGKAALAHHRRAKATTTVVVRNGAAKATHRRPLTLR